MGNVEGSGVPLIQNVRYNGNIDVNRVEIDEGKYLVNDNAGIKTFWAENQQVFGARDASQWQASTDTVISVDGVPGYDDTTLQPASYAPLATAALPINNFFIILLTP